MEGKLYTLIIGHDFSLSNETDTDVMSDYMPGIWAIKTFKKAIQYAQRLISEGNVIKVSCYDNPVYFAKANEAIKLLGLSQPLFNEPAPLEQKPITANVPKNFAQLKKHLEMLTGAHIKIKNYSPDGLTIARERIAKILKVGSTSMISTKTENDGKVWLEFGKASEWTFDNEGATYHYMNREGKYIPSVRVEYLP